MVVLALKASVGIVFGTQYLHIWVLEPSGFASGGREVPFLIRDGGHCQGSVCLGLLSN